MTALYSSPGANNLEALGLASTTTAGMLDAAAPGLPTALTASRALVTSGAGAPVVATTTAAEIGYVNGVTSAIQTQLNGKMTEWVTAPIAANSTGTAGQMAYASGSLYVCVATNTWQKVTIATF